MVTIGVEGDLPDYNSRRMSFDRGRRVSGGSTTVSKLRSLYSFQLKMSAIAEYLNNRHISKKERDQNQEERKLHKKRLGDEKSKSVADELTKIEAVEDYLEETMKIVQEIDNLRDTVIGEKSLQKP